MAPWADVQYSADGAWWDANKGLRYFDGLKISQDVQASCRYPEIVRVFLDRVDEVIVDKPEHIGWGGNSGFQAINLAIVFGARRLVLVGFDMCIKGGVHWHGRHGGALGNPDGRNVARWAAVLDRAAPAIAGYGVEVINTSADSALQAFRKMPLSEAIGSGQKHGTDHHLFRSAGVAAG